MSYSSHREVDLPILGDSVPVAEILPCDVEGEGLSGALNLAGSPGGYGKPKPRYVRM